MRGPALTLVPVTRVTSAQSVAQQILALIRSGNWSAGDKLPTEKELCEQLAVGRSTVREALQILATLNVVEPLAGQGTFVKSPTSAEVLRADLIGFLIGNTVALELLEARAMIEPNLARMACLRGTDADFARIEALLADHAAAHERGLPVSYHAARFHVLLAEAAHNRVAVTFMTSILELLTQRGRRVDHLDDYSAREIAEHRAIFEAIRARDAERAEEMLRTHIVESATTYDLEAPRTAPESAPQSRKSVRTRTPTA